MPSKNFETIQNIEQCNTKWIQNELIKTITDPPDSLIVNDKITISDYTIDNNNDGLAINVYADINYNAEDIIHKTMQNNCKETTILTEPKIEKIGKPKIEP